MRQPKHLSNTGLQTYEKDKETFYLRYLSDNRPEREPQSPAMALGSAFDILVKTSLAQDVLGPMSPVVSELEAMTDTQIDEPFRVEALTHGARVLEAYKQIGAYYDLREFLYGASDVRFESSLTRDVFGVPLNGKPDLSFTWYGFVVVLDWKVRGHYSKSGASPTPGYMRVRDGIKEDKAHSAFVEYADTNSQDCVYRNAHPLEKCSTSYADQLAMYSWLLGHDVGNAHVMTWLDEICQSGGKSPRIRVAQHRSFVSAEHQVKLRERYLQCWQAATSGYVFDYLSREDNDARCAVLDKVTQTRMVDDWFDFKKPVAF